ncbi:energy transducer TonB family protein, partial [Propylenella binzhouense]
KPAQAVPERRERTERQRPEPARNAPPRAAAKASTPAAAKAPVAAAQQSSSGAAPTVSPARWQARLLAHLERRKRYPGAARARGSEGTASVRFSIDASGNVLGASLARSSGVPELDQEVVAMVRRASPVPAPPPGVSRTITVPVRFSLR